MARTKIAIACQGGGSQTAFTAGVLKALCEANLQDQFEFVGISGTSGGALCATLVWYALRRGEQPIWRRLIEFWRDNTAQSGPERMINNTIIDWLRMVNRSPENVETLIAHGEERGRSFLAERARRVGAAGASPVN